jgi:hypothetical protein
MGNLTAIYNRKNYMLQLAHAAAAQGDLELAKNANVSHMGLMAIFNNIAESSAQYDKMMFITSPKMAKDNLDRFAFSYRA